jgi:hypothetical protein
MSVWIPGPILLEALAESEDAVQALTRAIGPPLFLAEDLNPRLGMPSERRKSSRP